MIAAVIRVKPSKDIESCALPRIIFIYISPSISSHLEAGYNQINSFSDGFETGMQDKGMPAGKPHPFEIFHHLISQWYKYKMLAAKSKATSPCLDSKKFVSKIRA